jgi:hypothetical protein
MQIHEHHHNTSDSCTPLVNSSSTAPFTQIEAASYLQQQVLFTLPRRSELEHHKERTLINITS